MALIAFVIIVVSLIIIYHKYSSSLQKWSLEDLKHLAKIPGDKKLSLIGFPSRTKRREKESISSRTECLFKKYDDGIYKVQVFDKYVVPIFNPNYVQKLLSSSIQIKKGYSYNFLKPWLGEGLLISWGEKWFSRRKLLTPAFHFNILKQFIPNFNHHASNLVKTLEIHTGQEIDIVPFITTSALGVLCETTMGIKLDDDITILERYQKKIYDVGHIVVNRFQNPFLHSDFIFFNFSKFGKSFLCDVKILHKFTLDVILKRIKYWTTKKNDDFYNDFSEFNEIFSKINDPKNQNIFANIKNKFVLIYLFLKKIFIKKIYINFTKKSNQIIVSNSFKNDEKNFKNLNKVKDINNEINSKLIKRNRNYKFQNNDTNSIERINNKNDEINISKTNNGNIIIPNDKYLDESNDKNETKKLAMLDLMIKYMIENDESNFQFDYKGIREEVDTFMFRGHDTTTSVISYTLFCLANNMNIQEKLYEELSEILNDDSINNITFNDLSKMEYLEMCIKESLRMYPPVPYFTRELIQILDLEKYKIPKRVHVAVLVYELHRNPKYWLNPNIFDPERFNFENSRLRHPFSYIPFSAGPRNCIGQKYAMLEVKLFIAKLIYNFKIEPIDTTESIKLILDLVLRTSNGIKVKLVKR